MKTQEIFEFGPYRLQPVERLLLRNGEPVPVTSKVFDLLVVLVENAGVLLERDRLLRTLWPDSFIEENNLTVNVSTLRKVLAEGGGPAPYIETVPKRGYRFVAVVHSTQLEPTPFAAQSAPPPLPATVVAPVAPSRSRIHPIYGLAALVVGLGAIAAVVVLRNSSSDPAPALRALPFTAYPGSEYTPTISPDGTRVAFTWAAPTDRTQGIYVKGIGGGDAIRLSPAAEALSDPAWSPDGTQIACINWKTGTLELVLMPAVGGMPRKLAEIQIEQQVHGNVLSWSPDGNWIVVASRESGASPLRIEAVSTETGQKKALTTPPATIVGDGHPAISPDGRRLAFSRNNTTVVGDFYVLDLGPDLSTRGQPRRLTNFENQTGGAAWTPNGREIVVSAGPPLGGFRLYRVPVDRRGSAEELPPIPYIGIDGRGPAISRPNGQEAVRLVYEKVSGQYSLWRVDLTGGKGAQSVPWAPSTQMDQSPDISPDGKKAAFASTRSGNWEIWSCEISGTSCVQLTNLGRSFSRSPRWSPDGSQIVFDSRIGGNADIYVIDAAGGKPRQLTMEPSNDVLPSWSADGRWIYFSSNRSGESRIWKVPSGGGTARMVSQIPGEGPRESRDGKWVYFVGRGSAAGIWRMPAAGGAEEKLVPDAPFGLGFILGERGIHYVMTDGEERRLVYYDLASMKKSIVFRQDRIDYNGLALSPDGTYLLYVQAAAHNSDLMLVDHFR